LKKSGELTEALDKTNETEYFAIAVIGLGALIFVVSFCGCCGAIRESECFLNLYSLALICIAILQMILALYTCLYNEEIQKGTETAWDTLWKGKSHEINLKTIEEIQKFVGCCGDTGVSSYVPDNNKCEAKYYSKPCREEVKIYVKDSSSLISYVSFGMAIIEVIYRESKNQTRDSFYFFKFQIVGVVFGCILSAHIRNNRNG
jgi:CD63 antigen